MITIQVGELKTNFSSYLKQVRDGEEIAVAFDKKNETMAYLIPADKYLINKVKIGLGQEKGYSYSDNVNLPFSNQELEELFDID